MTSSGDALVGRTVLVTGASSGIGLAVATAAARSGARVVMVARREAALEAAAGEIGGRAVAADVADPTAVERLRAEAQVLFGDDAPDVLVNSAGAFELAPLAETTTEMFDRQIGVNVRAPFLLIRAFLPAMLRRGSGHIVTIGSVAGRRAFPHNGAYSASKFAVRGLHAVLDTELRGTGVRATLVEPAATDTPLWDAIDRERNPELPPRAAMLSPGAVADAVLYAVTQPVEAAVPNLIIERS